MCAGRTWPKPSPHSFLLRHQARTRRSSAERQRDCRADHQALASFCSGGCVGAIQRRYNFAQSAASGWHAGPEVTRTARYFQLVAGFPQLLSSLRVTEDGADEGLKAAEFPVPFVASWPAAATARVPDRSFASEAFTCTFAPSFCSWTALHLRGISKGSCVFVHQMMLLTSYLRTGSNDLLSFPFVSSLASLRRLKAVSCVTALLCSFCTYPSDATVLLPCVYEHPSFSALFLRCMTLNVPVL